MSTKSGNELSNETFERFRKCVEASGFSYPTLEKLSGVPKSNIQRYIQKQSKIPFDCFVKISLAIGESPAALLGWCEEPQKNDSLTQHEKNVLKAYRGHPEMHSAVDTLLGLEQEAKKENLA